MLDARSGYQHWRCSPYLVFVLLHTNGLPLLNRSTTSRYVKPIAGSFRVPLSRSRIFSATAFMRHAWYFGPSLIRGAHLSCADAMLVTNASTSRVRFMTPL